MGQSRRLELHAELVVLLNSNNVYFQPDINTGMKYPCIVYARDPAYSASADNITYRSKQRWQITLIDRLPDNPVYDTMMTAFSYCSTLRSYKAEGLNHDVFDLYY